jgi:hypothetical protein
VKYTNYVNQYHENINKNLAAASAERLPESWNKFAVEKQSLEDLVRNKLMGLEDDGLATIVLFKQFLSDNDVKIEFERLGTSSQMLAKVRQFSEHPILASKNKPLRTIFNSLLHTVNSDQHDDVVQIFEKYVALIQHQEDAKHREVYEKQVINEEGRKVFSLEEIKNQREFYQKQNIHLPIYRPNGETNEIGEVSHSSNIIDLGEPNQYSDPNLLDENNNTV